MESRGPDPRVGHVRARPSDGRVNQEDGDVSKRPKSANAVMSRLRRPAGRLRDLPIWSKLGLIMLVPTLATIIVGVSGLVDHIEEASNAERARTLSVLSQNAGDLVDHLQNERAHGVLITTTKPDT